MHVHYRVASQRAWNLPYDPYANYAAESDYGFHDASVAEGDLVADGNGRGIISFVAPSVTQTQEIDVRVEAHDDSGRTISTRLGVFNYPSAIDARAKLESWFVVSGVASNVTVRAEDRDRKPVAGQSCDLSISLLHWNARTKKYDSGRTDAHVHIDRRARARDVRVDSYRRRGYMRSTSARRTRLGVSRMNEHIRWSSMKRMRSRTAHRARCS